MKKRILYFFTMSLVMILLFFTCIPPEEKTDDKDDDDDDSSTIYAICDTRPSGVGIVFYITNGGLHGLESAPSDQSTSQSWSNVESFVNGSSALPSGIGTGSANTDAIIAQLGHSASAAKVCRDYAGGSLTDWFLPSKDELNELYSKKDIVGGFENTANYWSSSEFGINGDLNAYGQLFSNGSQGGLYKGDSYRVRAIRAF